MSFPARFAGTCGNCHNPIEIGQYIGWNRRGVKKVYHRDCQNVWAKPEVTNETPETEQPKDASEMNSEAVSQDAAQTLASAIQAIAGKAIDETKVQEIAKSTFKSMSETFQDSILKLMVENSKPRELEVTRLNGESRETVNVGLAHKNFDLLVKVASAHTNETPINIWLTGPAGSGKTKACEMLSKALGVKFAFSGAIMEPYSLLGYKDANGNLVRTPFREIYEFGGVFLQDEIDGSSANALLPFNAALANGHCAFPDGIIPRHKDCIIIAAANTFGLGGNSDYVGRVKLDAATLSRYVFIDWPYDEELEKALCGNLKWFERVTAIRHKAQSLGLKLLITPRATYTGASLLASGIPQSQVELMVLKQGMTDSQWNQISGRN